MKLKDLTVDRYRIEAKTTIPLAVGREHYIHPLVGSGEVSLKTEYTVREYGVRGRDSVFEAPTMGLLSSGCTLVVAPDRTLDLIIASAPTKKQHDPVGVSIQPKRHTIGSGHTLRTVYEILGGDGPADRIRCGETMNVRGGWSSWPPHSFDADDSLASEFEEIFVPFLRPRDGTAVLRMRGKFHDGSKVDDALALRSGEMVSVPLGYHPIAGGPETDLMYVWFYLCPVAKAYGKWAEDCGCYL